MKKYDLLYFLALILFVACGERYTEERGKVFEGTWTHMESYINGEKVAAKKGRFISIRDFEGEKLLLFYSGGRYDSSFFYRLHNNNIFVRRVQDSVDVIYRYPLYDTDGKPILDDNGKQVVVSDTVREPQKPLTPETGFIPEKYYGTYSLQEGATLNLIIQRFKTNDKGTPTEELMIEDVYERPEEID